MVDPTAKPNGLRWLCDKVVEPEGTIRARGFTPRVTFLADAKISEWGITWRDTPTSLGFVTKIGQKQMAGGPRFEIIGARECEDKDNVCLVFASVPVAEGTPVDCFAVVLPAKKCMDSLCSKEVQEAAPWGRGENTTVKSDDILDVIDTLGDKVMEEKTKSAVKPSPKKRGGRKSAVEAGTGTVTPETGETQATGESSRKKKGKAAAAEGEGGRQKRGGKKEEKKQTVAEALMLANNLTSKTKDTDVLAMYQTLEEGLGHCFPNGQRALPCQIPYNRIHIAPDEFKYRAIFRKRQDQISLFYKGLGAIRKKPELYCLPMSGDPRVKDPVTGEIKLKGLEGLLRPMPALNVKFSLRQDDGTDKLVPWYEDEGIHWYIIGGQHTFEACRELGEKEPQDSPMRQYYLNHDIIPVYADNKDTLIKVSNALNIEVKDKVAEVSFRSQLEKMRAKWIERGRIDKKDDYSAWKVIHIFLFSCCFHVVESRRRPADAQVVFRIVIVGFIYRFYFLLPCRSFARSTSVRFSESPLRSKPSSCP
jgi:hypothetical protein